MGAVGFDMQGAEPRRQLIRPQTIAGTIAINATSRRLNGYNCPIKWLIESQSLPYASLSAGSLPTTTRLGLSLYKLIELWYDLE